MHYRAFKVTICPTGLWFNQNRIQHSLVTLETKLEMSSKCTHHSTVDFQRGSPADLNMLMNHTQTQNGAHRQPFYSSCSINALG